MCYINKSVTLARSVPATALTHTHTRGSMATQRPVHGRTPPLSHSTDRAAGVCVRACVSCARPSRRVFLACWLSASRAATKHKPLNSIERGTGPAGSGPAPASASVIIVDARAERVNTIGEVSEWWCERKKTSYFQNRHAPRAITSLRPASACVGEVMTTNIRAASKGCLVCGKGKDNRVRWIR